MTRPRQRRSSRALAEAVRGVLPRAGHRVEPTRPSARPRTSTSRARLGAVPTRPATPDVQRCYGGAIRVPSSSSRRARYAARKQGSQAQVRTLVPAVDAGTLSSPETPRALFVVMAERRERQLFRVVDWTAHAREQSTTTQQRPRVPKPILHAGGRLIVAGAIAMIALFGSVAALAAWTTFTVARPTLTLSPPTGISAVASAPSVTVGWDAPRLTSDRTRSALRYTVTRYDDDGAVIGPASCGDIPSSGGSLRHFTCTDTPGVGTFKYRITATSRSLTAWSGFTDSVTVGSTSTSVASTMNPSVVGERVAFTATVASVPAGIPTRRGGVLRWPHAGRSLRRSQRHPAEWLDSDVLRHLHEPHRRPARSQRHLSGRRDPHGLDVGPAVPDGGGRFTRLRSRPCRHVDIDAAG